MGVEAYIFSENVIDKNDEFITFKTKPHIWNENEEETCLYFKEQEVLRMDSGKYDRKKLPDFALYFWRKYKGLIGFDGGFADGWFTTMIESNEWFDDIDIKIDGRDVWTIYAIKFMGQDTMILLKEFGDENDVKELEKYIKENEPYYKKMIKLSLDKKLDFVIDRINAIKNDLNEGNYDSVDFNFRGIQHNIEEFYNEFKYSTDYDELKKQKQVNNTVELSEDDGLPF